MEMNVLIEGSEEKPSIARDVASALTFDRGRILCLGVGRKLTNIKSGADVLVAIREKSERIMQRPDVIVFEFVFTPDDLLHAVEGLKLYREHEGRQISAVFVCEPAAIVLSNSVPFIIERGEINEEQREKLSEALEDMGSPLGKILTAESSTTIGFANDLPFLVAFDEGKESHDAAVLWQGDKLLAEARNLRTYLPAHGETVIFELASQERRLNGFMDAVDKCTTSYFKSGKFEKRSYNSERVRYASDKEIQEYLILKYEFNERR